MIVLELWCILHAMERFLTDSLVFDLVTDRCMVWVASNDGGQIVLLLVLRRALVECVLYVDIDVV